MRRDQDELRRVAQRRERAIVATIMVLVNLAVLGSIGTVTAKAFERFTKSLSHVSR